MPVPMLTRVEGFVLLPAVLYFFVVMPVHNFRIHSRRMIGLRFEVVIRGSAVFGIGSSHENFHQSGVCCDNWGRTSWECARRTTSEGHSFVIS